MLSLLIHHWQVTLISVLMVVGAVIDAWKLKVPNWLTFPMIVSGWLYWGVASIQDGQWNLLGHSILGAFVAGLPLLLMRAVGGMGAGDVKMYAGFGAWMVPVPEFGYINLAWCFAWSAIVGGVLALLMVAKAGAYDEAMANARTIMADAQTGSIATMAERAKERKPRARLLPYGVPLTIGSLAYVGWWLYQQMPRQPM